MFNIYSKILVCMKDNPFNSAGNGRHRLQTTVIEDIL